MAPMTWTPQVEDGGNAFYRLTLNLTLGLKIHSYNPESDFFPQSLRWISVVLAVVLVGDRTNGAK